MNSMCSVLQHALHRESRFKPSCVASEGVADSKDVLFGPRGIDIPVTSHQLQKSIIGQLLVQLLVQLLSLH
jgi:hypothetical protein